MSNAIHLKITSPQGRSEKVVGWGQLESFQIGRSDTADLFLNDPSVSRQHCRLFAREDRLYVEDLSSRRGTIINGELTTVEYVDDGAELRLGDVSIQVHFDRQHDPAPVSAPIDGFNENDLPAPPSGNDSEITLVSRPGASGRRRIKRNYDIRITKDEFTVGRDQAACDFKLDDLNVSRRHFQIKRLDGRFYLKDLDTTNGTHLNGIRLTSEAELAPGDAISVGSFHLIFDGGSLVSKVDGLGYAISALDLAVPHPRPAPGQSDWILREISFHTKPGEFIGLLGTSGAGKSTLLRALSARSTTASHGYVTYDGENLHERFDSFRAGIGYVPQKDIFHEDLTLMDALQYASRLRLSKDATSQEIEQNIDRVLKLVELDDKRATVIKNLSGGQKRRVSIAIELLTNPRVLFLDEVTSGLDPYLESQMMELFRRLADEQGITIFIITHHADSVELCDKIIYLNKGLLTFFGTPNEAKTFFRASAFTRIYHGESKQSPEEWRAAFERTPEFARWIDNQAHSPAELTTSARPPSEDAVKTDWPRLKAQGRTLTERYIKVFLADRLNVLVFCLGPVVAGLLCILSKSIAEPVGQQFTLCVGSVIILFFLGVFSSVREIVKELDIYRHEHFRTVEILPYLVSKVLPQAAIGLIQSVAVVLIIKMFGSIDLAGSSLTFVLVLFLTYLAATLLGLAISAAVTTSDLAIMVMLFFVIPQILFGGAINGPTGPSGGAAMISKTFITDYWSLEAAKSLIHGRHRLPSEGFGKSVAMILFHSLIYSGAAVFFMAAKDGPDTTKNLKRVLASVTGNARAS